MASLTVAKVRDLTKAGRYGDGGGLYLSIAPGGSKSWVMRVSVGGKRTDKGLGGSPAVSLSAARKIADAYRVEVSEGRNPWTDVEREHVEPAREHVERAQALTRLPTFAEASRKVHRLKVDGGQIGNTKSAKNWLQVLKRHVFPVFGDVPVDEIGKSDVMGVLDRLGPELPETARRLRQRMREIFDWCVMHDYITVNPAGDAIRGSVKRWSGHRKVTHFKALPYQQMPGVVDRILDSQGMRETRLALAFVVLTAARSGEVRGARWDEIENGVWTIPAERMKADRPHAVPLSIQASVVLQDARAAAGKRQKSEKRRPGYDPSLETDYAPKEGLIFPHPSGQPLSENALSLRTRKDKLGCTPHGFRSSFKGWATADGHWSWEAIELCLAHRVGNSVAQAYFRDDLLEQRRAVMQEWADYVWNIRPF